MCRDRSTERLDSRQDSDNQKTLRLPDGSKVKLLGIEDTPSGRWLRIRPGGWVPAAWLAEL